MRARRVAAALVVALAMGSAALGAARGTDEGLQVVGSLSGEPQPAPVAATGTRAQATASPRPSSAAPTSSATTSTPSPSSKTVPTHGNGKREPVRVPGQDSSGPGRVVTYAFEVEGGLGIDRAAAAKIVGAALRDPRGWQGVDRVRFVQVSSAQLAKGVKPTVTISLVSPKMTDAMCAPLSTDGTWSCANKDHAVLNYRRWELGTPSYAAKSLGEYRHYVVNHEVGHELGHPHVSCSGPGKPAAVMVQQSKGLSGCTANVWPKPTRG